MKHLSPSKKLAFVLRSFRGEPKVKICEEAKISRPTLDSWERAVTDSAPLIFTRGLAAKLKKLENENRGRREEDAADQVTARSQESGIRPQREEVTLDDGEGNLKWLEEPDQA